MFAAADLSWLGNYVSPEMLGQVQVGTYTPRANMVINGITGDPRYPVFYPTYIPGISTEGRLNFAPAGGGATVPLDPTIARGFGNMTFGELAQGLGTYYYSEIYNGVHTPTQVVLEVIEDLLNGTWKYRMTERPNPDFVVPTPRPFLVGWGPQSPEWAPPEWRIYDADRRGVYHRNGSPGDPALEMPITYEGPPSLGLVPGGAFDGIVVCLITFYPANGSPEVYMAMSVSDYGVTEYTIEFNNYLYFLDPDSGVYEFVVYRDGTRASNTAYQVVYSSIDGGSSYGSAVWYTETAGGEVVAEQFWTQFLASVEDIGDAQ